MNDDIKEILEALKPQDEEFTKAGIKEYPLRLSIEEQKILLDYITNLQDKIKKYEYFSLGDKYIIENADILDKPVDFMINKIKCFLEELVKNKKIKDESSREIIVTMLTLNEDRIHWLNTCFLVEEENKELKHKLEQMYNDTKDTYNEISAEQIDYKSRNEKAIEEIDIIDTTLLSNINSYIAYKIEKKILQGSDKE